MISKKNISTSLAPDDLRVLTTEAIRRKTPVSALIRELLEPEIERLRQVQLPEQVNRPSGLGRVSL